MNTRKLTLLFTALVGLAVSAFAQGTATEATIVGLSGTATLTMPDGTAVPVAAGAKVPAGASIKTGDNSKVFIQAFQGTIATVDANTEISISELSQTSAGGKVTQETTTIDLKSGNLVSALDPTKKSVNNYKVRTPKGVAAARGTSFSVSLSINVNGVEYNVVATSGRLEITPVGGGAPISIVGGQVSMSGLNGGSATNLAEVPEGQAKTTAVTAMGNVLAALAVAADNGLINRAEFTAVTQNVMSAVGNDAAAAQTIAQTVAQSTSNAESRNAVTDAASSSVKQSVQQTIEATQIRDQITTPDGSNRVIQATSFDNPTTGVVPTNQSIDVSVISKSN